MSNNYFYFCKIFFDFDWDFDVGLEGTMPIIMIMEGTRPPTGASPTQPYKCSQYFKIKVNVKTSAVLADAEINKLASPR